MEEVVVLLIDLGAGGGLADSVRQILASPNDRRFTILERSVGRTDRSPDVRAIISSVNPDVILLILTLPSMERARAAVREASSGDQVRVPVVIVSGDCPAAHVAELIALGAADFVVAPVRSTDLLLRVRQLANKRSEEDSVVKRLKESVGLEQMVGRNPAFLAEVRKIPLVAKCDAGVLITGETGTGKEIFARALHYLSPRSGHPFVAVNCGAIPSELVENELFGHVRGAFTGAHASQPGLIFEANEGTLFLDDVDALPLAAQVKFLRVLQEREYKQLGSTKTRHADIRVVSTTNINLDEAVKNGKFRSDLFYRLNVIPLALPSLRDRIEDVPLLAEHFIEKYSYEFGKEVGSLSSDALSLLMAHDWSGNVRELENVIERAVVFCMGSTIEPTHIVLPAVAGRAAPLRTESLREAKTRMVAQFEKGYIEDLLRKHRGNISEAARAAQKNRRAFWELLRKHKVSVGAPAK